MFAKGVIDRRRETAADKLLATFSATFAQVFNGKLGKKQMPRAFFFVPTSFQSKVLYRVLIFLQGFLKHL